MHLFLAASVYPSISDTPFCWAVVGVVSIGDTIETAPTMAQQTGYTRWTEKTLAIKNRDMLRSGNSTPEGATDGCQMMLIKRESSQFIKPLSSAT